MPRDDSLPTLPDRDSESHKGTFGKVIAIAGSRGMAGAASLVGMAALRAGAGLVTVAIPEGIGDIVASLEPSYLTRPLPQDGDGRFDRSAREPLFDAVAGKDAVAIGPGLGRSDFLGELTVELVRELSVPLVIDADGLNALASRDDWRTEFPAVRVLTPHPGEFSRLTGRDITEIQANREEIATEYAAQAEVLLLLKGHGTVITNGDRTVINRTGNPGMATGGTGDVLTGLILGLLGDSRLEPFDAVHLAAHLHGVAGDLAATELSQPGMVASDLIAHLPLAWDEYLRTAGDDW